MAQRWSDLEESALRVGYSRYHNEVQKWKKIRYDPHFLKIFESRTNNDIRRKWNASMEPQNEAARALALIRANNLITVYVEAYTGALGDVIVDEDAAHAAGIAAVNAAVNAAAIGAANAAAEAALAPNAAVPVVVPVPDAVVHVPDAVVHVPDAVVVPDGGVPDDVVPVPDIPDYDDVKLIMNYGSSLKLKDAFKAAFYYSKLDGLLVPYTDDIQEKLASKFAKGKPCLLVNDLLIDIFRMRQFKVSDDSKTSTPLFWLDKKSTIHFPAEMKENEFAVLPKTEGEGSEKFLVYVPKLIARLSEVVQNKEEEDEVLTAYNDLLLQYKEHSGDMAWLSVHLRGAVDASLLRRMASLYEA